MAGIIKNKFSRIWQGSILVLAMLCAGQLYAAQTAGVEPVATKTPQVHVIHSPDFDVYKAYIEETFGFEDALEVMEAERQAGARKLIILENDSLDTWQQNRRAWEAYLLQKVEGQARADTHTARDFIYRKNRILRFYQFPQLSNRLRLVRSDYLSGMFQQGGWAAFWEKYPGSAGLLTLSGIGWNKDKTEAIFTIRLACGDRCGYRTLVLMRRLDKVWQTIFKEQLP